MEEHFGRQEDTKLNDAHVKDHKHEEDFMNGVKKCIELKFKHKETQLLESIEKKLAERFDVEMKKILSVTRSIDSDNSVDSRKKNSMNFEELRTITMIGWKASLRNVNIFSSYF